MIIQQTTTIIFQYPQDYLQEQEWCKTKEDRWIHKGTDTLGAVYENTISYSIGQPNNSEETNNSTISKMEQVKEPYIDIETGILHWCGWKYKRIYEDEPQTGVSYSDHTDYDEPKTYVTWTEPQTERSK